MVEIMNLAGMNRASPDRRESIENTRLLSDQEGLERFHEQQKQAALPDVDGGFEAWSFLAGTWMAEAMLWGVRYCIDAYT